MKYKVGDIVLIPSYSCYKGKIKSIDNNLINISWVYDSREESTREYSVSDFELELKHDWFRLSKNIDPNLVCKKLK